jgi:hypothetical protein
MRWMAPLVLVVALPLACAEEEAAETREGFCDRWAVAACTQEVVSACVAEDDACRLSQERACLELVPTSGFVDERADECVDAVGAAYSDADLTASELETVLRLGAPCDRLVRGRSAAGETCATRLDCDGPGGYDCVLQGGDPTGTCQKPVLVQPGRDCSADSAVCSSGFYCDGNNCIEANATGEACSRDDQCAAGYCGNTNLCVAGLATNQPCTLDVECASGLCYRFSATEQVCTDRVRLSRTDPLCEAAR